MEPDKLAALARLLEKHVAGKAAEFVADPSKGHMAGYAPEHSVQAPQEIGSNARVQARSDLVAWMFGVARRDLKAWEWTIEVVENETILTIERLRAGYYI